MEMAKKILWMLYSFTLLIITQRAGTNENIDFYIMKPSPKATTLNLLNPSRLICSLTLPLCNFFIPFIYLKSLPFCTSEVLLFIQGSPPEWCDLKGHATVGCSGENSDLCSLMSSFHSLVNTVVGTGITDGNGSRARQTQEIVHLIQDPAKCKSEVLKGFWNVRLCIIDLTCPRHEEWNEAVASCLLLRLVISHVNYINLWMPVHNYTVVLSAKPVPNFLAP